MHVIVLTKRQYTNRDVIDDRYGRLWEIPLSLTSEKCTVTCVCLSYLNKSTVPLVYEDARGRSIRWISVNLGFFKITGFLKYLYLTNKIIRDERADVIWSCSDTIYTVIGYYLSKLHKCCFIADLYDNFEYFGSYKIPLLRWLYRKAVRNADGVSCVSNSLHSHITTTYGRTKNTTVITNAVDSNAFQPMDKVECRDKLGLPQDVLLIGSAGDVSNYRGADMMYQVATKEPVGLRGVHLVVAGYRTPDTAIPDTGNIHDLGLLAPEDVPILLNSLDLAIVYNRSSSFGDFCFPQKFYEILSCGVPIVAANVGEIGSMLKDHPHFLYADGDIESLVLAIERQLKERKLPDLQVPSWQEQANLLRRQMETVMTSS